MTERVGLLTDAIDTRAKSRRNRLSVDQTAVSVDRRQPVAEFVCDPCRQFAKPGQRFFQLQLLLELDDRREIGEQADGAAVRRRIAERRDGDAKVPRPATHRPQAGRVG